MVSFSRKIKIMDLVEAIEAADRYAAAAAEAATASAASAAAAATAAAAAAEAASVVSGLVARRIRDHADINAPASVKKDMKIMKIIKCTYINK